MHPKTRRVITSILKGCIKEVNRARKYTSQSRVKVTFEVAKEDMSQIALNMAFEGEREFWKVPERR